MLMNQQGRISQKVAVERGLRRRHVHEHHGHHHRQRRLADHRARLRRQPDVGRTPSPSPTWSAWPSSFPPRDGSVTVSAARRVLLTAIVVFTVGLGPVRRGVEPRPSWCAFRILQGVGGGMLAPVGMAMLFRAFPPAERVRASSILTVPTALAPALGPVLGGLLVTDLSWRWVFFVNVPIGIAALVFGLLFLQTSAESQAGSLRPAPGSSCPAPAWGRSCTACPRGPRRRVGLGRGAGHHGRRRGGPVGRPWCSWSCATAAHDRPAAARQPAVPIGQRRPGHERHRLPRHPVRRRPCTSRTGGG